jgi:predicted transcriptional regulator
MTTATALLYLRLDPSLKRKIDRIAAKRDRSANYVASEALRKFVESELPSQSDEKPTIPATNGRP